MQALLTTKSTVDGRGLDVETCATAMFDYLYGSIANTHAVLTLLVLELLRDKKLCDEVLADVDAALKTTGGEWNDTVRCVCGPMCVWSDVSALRCVVWCVAMVAELRSDAAARWSAARGASLPRRTDACAAGAVRNLACIACILHTSVVTQTSVCSSLPLSSLPLSLSPSLPLSLSPSLPLSLCRFACLSPLI